MRKLTIALLLLVHPVVAREPDDSRPRMSVSAGMAQIMVYKAIEGARRRLADDGCRRILDDFVDGTGASLADHLEARSLTPSEHLSQIWFVDGTGEVPCDDSLTAAFTTQGGRVVFICAARFASAQDALCGPAGEIIVIHEFLHTLGLGENPPTSNQITQRVWQRCGRV